MSSARQNRRMETRKALGAGEDWRGRVAGLPAKGQRFLHPERRQERRIARVED